MKEVPSINLIELHKETWSPEEKKNVDLVANFVQKLMNEHDFKSVQKTFGHGQYTQHNRSMTDGIEGVIASVKNLTKQFPEFSYDVKYIHADGKHIIFHSHATMNARDRGNEKKGFIIFDTWKVNDGKIVEHWDALQPLDFGMRLFLLFTGGSIKNNNGLF